jgi:hypothetical protein
VGLRPVARCRARPDRRPDLGESPGAHRRLAGGAGAAAPGKPGSWPTPSTSSRPANSGMKKLN